MGELPLHFHPAARDEALRAHDWYADRSMDAAEAFQNALEHAGRAITESPKLWASYLFGTRRYVMKRFPFVVIYRVTKRQIEIIAVAHGHRRPGYWSDRLGTSE